MSRLAEVLDGLLLGRGRLEAAGAGARFRMVVLVRHLPWARAVADVLSQAGLEVRCRVLEDCRGRMELCTAASLGLEAERARWYREAKTLPGDVRLTATALAFWFSSAGVRASNGYSAHFGLRWATMGEAERIAGELARRFRWRPDVFLDRGRPVLRLSRSGDRLGLQRLVAGMVPPCFAGRLVFRESRPCSEEQAARRRRPAVVPPDRVAEIRRRVLTGELYPAIAQDYGLSPSAVGRIARGETHRDPNVSIVRRHAPTRRLTGGQARQAREMAANGASQRAIAAALGVGQPRVSRMLRRA